MGQRKDLILSLCWRISPLAFLCSDGDDSARTDDDSSLFWRGDSDDDSGNNWRGKLDVDELLFLLQNY